MVLFEDVQVSIKKIDENKVALTIFLKRKAKNIKTYN